MGLIDNCNIIRKKLPYLWNQHDFSSMELMESAQCFKVVAANNKLPTLLYVDGSQQLYIHSKYDPLQEGQKLIHKYENIAEYDHVFFYGLGLGYHVEEFVKEYPNIEFSIYEPSEEIFYKYLETGDLENVFNSQLRKVYIEKNTADSANLLQEFVNEYTDKKVLLIFLPSYERVFKERFSQFIKLYNQIVVEQRASFNVNAAFQKLWIINSLINLPEILRTPNVLHDLDREKFRNRPALLVAAGPSLEEDIEHIRAIKERGLAYVFSLGSAISVLISNGIYPDAACTYDPQSHNSKVFDKVISQEITEIPLIFGSSVGFETILKYPGQKIHMITSQDTVAPFLLKLKSGEKIDTVMDSPSIAVITLQLVQKLGFSPIILSGQNLAFKDHKRYAKGIEYYDDINKLTEKDLEEIIRVEDVYGNVVHTNSVFEQMRQQMEIFIRQYSGIEVINTTKGGANIKGTAFKPIDELIKERLQDRVVQDGWLKGNNQYDKDCIKEKLILLESEKNKLIKALNRVIQVFREFNTTIENSDSNKAIKLFSLFDKSFIEVTKNIFYKTFLLPMNRVQYELMLKHKNEIKFEENPISKSQIIIEEYGKFVYVCHKDLKNFLNLWETVYLEVVMNN